MKNIIFIGLGVLIIAIFPGYKYIVKGDVVIKIEGKPIVKKTSPLTITLIENFSDSLKILVNNKIVKYGFFKTNESTTITDQFVLSPKDLNDLKKITIQVISANKIRKQIAVPIKKGYSIILIGKDGDVWTLTYTNQMRTYD